jgi:hypothetical protein
MNPNMYIEEKRLLERVQKRLRETEQQSAPATITHQAPDHNVLQHLIGSLGTRLVVLGARMQQFAQTAEQPVSRGCSASISAGRGGVVPPASSLAGARPTVSHRRR